MNWNKLFHSKATSRLEHFQHTMELAEKIAGSDPPLLLDLIKILLRPLQASLMLRVIDGSRTGPREIQQRNFFMGEKHASIFKESIALTPDTFTVRLTSDVILPWPWCKKRLISALTYIGEGKPYGPWKEDANHYLTLWLPWEIAFVHSGNHSITAGIIKGEGEITPRYVYDMSSVLDDVECDGQVFRCRKNGRSITKVVDARIAAVFEIGRLIRENKR